MDKDSLLKIAQAACDAAVSGGAEFADVSAGFGRSQSVDLERNAIKSCDSRQGGHVSVRAICKGGTGWSSTDKATVEAAVEAGSNAARLAKLAEPDPDFISLPGPAGSYPEIAGLCDPRIADIDIKQLIKSALANVDGAVAVCSDATVQGGVSSWYGSHALVNSRGVSVASDGSYIGGYIMAIVRRGDDVGSF